MLAQATKTAATFHLVREQNKTRSATVCLPQAGGSGFFVSFFQFADEKALKINQIDFHLSNSFSVSLISSIIRLFVSASFTAILTARSPIFFPMLPTSRK